MKIYENLQAGMMFKRDNEVKWQCMNCGNIHIGKEAPPEIRYRTSLI
ncbi:hypothetical protein [Clostridium tagluense]|nr:hypothetical protein [Clostridium tagluense]MCB2298793.1 hypothetical protein [Clostridium tagluense]